MAWLTVRVVLDWVTVELLVLGLRYRIDFLLAANL
jgi:hypothetical protein